MLKQLTTELVAPDSTRASAPTERSQTLRLEWRVVLALALGAVFLWGQFWLQSEHLASGPANDFLVTYGAAKASGAADIFDPAGLAFQHTPLLALLSAPLALLPYPHAYWAWSMLAAWSVVGFILLWRPPSTAWTAIATLVSAPLFLAFLDGRSTPLLLLFLAAGVAAARGGRNFHAGLWLSLCLVEVQLFFLLPIALVAQRRWAMLRGMTVGVFALLSLSTWSAGLDWPWRLAEAWAAYPLAGSAAPTLAGFAFSAEALFLAGVALAGAVWALAVRSELGVAVGSAVAAGLLISPRAEITDAVLLLPLAVTLFATARLQSLRWTALLLLSPGPYFLPGGYAMHVTAALAALMLALLLGERLAAHSRTSETPLAPELHPSA